MLKNPKLFKYFSKLTYEVQGYFEKLKFQSEVRMINLF